MTGYKSMLGPPHDLLNPSPTVHHSFMFPGPSLWGWFEVFPKGLFGSRATSHPGALYLKNHMCPAFTDPSPSFSFLHQFLLAPLRVCLPGPSASKGFKYCHCTGDSSTLCGLLGFLSFLVKLMRRMSPSLSLWYQAKTQWLYWLCNLEGVLSQT